MNDQGIKYSVVVKTFSAIVVLLTPAAYLIGLALYQGGLNAYGISSDNFPTSLSNTYVHFYVAMKHVFSNLIIELEPLFTYITIPPGANYALVTLLTIPLLYHRRRVFYRLFSPVKKYLVRKILLMNINHSYSDEYLLAGALLKTWLIAYLVLIVISVIIILGVLWIYIPYGFYKIGMRAQEKDITEYLEKGCFYNKENKWSNCVTLIDKNGAILCEGLLIAVSDKNIALFSGRDSMLITKQKEFIVSNKYKTNISSTKNTKKNLKDSIWGSCKY